MSVAEAERQTLRFLRKFCYAKTAPLCGNSIWQDKQFLARYMPELHGFMHYRIVDVSSLKLLVKHWYPNAAASGESLDAPRARRHRRVDRRAALLPVDPDRSASAGSE